MHSCEGSSEAFILKPRELRRLCDSSDPGVEMRIPRCEFHSRYMYMNHMPRIPGSPHYLDVKIERPRAPANANSFYEHMPGLIALQQILPHPHTNPHTYEDSGHATTVRRTQASHASNVHRYIPPN
jgi:hypothetical protein